jgi:hypothetical protein
MTIKLSKIILRLPAWVRLGKRQPTPRTTRRSGDNPVDRV